MKGVYELREDEGETILSLVTSVMRAGYVMKIEGPPNQSWCDQKLMDYVKFSGWELGAMIKRNKWVEGMDIGYWS